jgi:SAM-dependent methyltransferase
MINNSKNNQIVKLVLLKFFKRDNKIIKILSIIKNSYSLFKDIKKINLKYSFILIPKIIKSLYFIEKNKNKIFNNDKKLYFDKKYKFDYDDWFSPNIEIWEKFVNKINNINYLEIGSFEGRSTVFVSELENLSSITAVDTWKGSNEYDSKTSFLKIFENFKKNIRTTNKTNINYFKTTSDAFFENNKNSFNLIYIDGHHEYSQVKKDFLNSFNCLKKNGYIICDDFKWFFYEDINKNPMKAILECYEINRKNLSIKFLNDQAIFKKIN